MTIKQFKKNQKLKKMTFGEIVEYFKNKNK